MSTHNRLIKKFHCNHRADVVVLTVIICVAVLLIVATVRYIKFLRLDIMSVNVAAPILTVDAEVLVFRNEQVITAPADGVFVPDVNEYSRVREGSVLGYIEYVPAGTVQTQRVQVLSPSSGIVSFTLDGWENVLADFNEDEIDREQLLSVWLSGSVETAMAQQQMLAGHAADRPVAKLIDNLSPRLLMIYSKVRSEDLLDNYGQLTLQLDGLPGTDTLFIHEQGKLSDGRWYMLAKVSAADDILLKKRHVNATLQFNTSGGILLPADAVFINEKKITGVLRLEGSMAVFVPVEIRLDLGTELLVDGLADGDRIIVRHNQISAGQHAY